MRVGLISTAALDAPGSMRAYVDTICAALSSHESRITFEVVELDAGKSDNRWLRRLDAVSLPWRFWRRRGASPDVWHIIDGSRGYLSMTPLNQPVVITVHDLIPWLQTQGRFPGAPGVGAGAKALWRANGRSFGGADALVCVSHATARDLQDAFAPDPSRVHVVHHPVRPGLDCFLPASRNPVDGSVLHVGNNGFYKNRSGAMSVFARLDASIARRLVMIGPAPDDALLRHAHELKIGERLEWIVDGSDETLARCYSQAHAMLFPSIYEGFGWPALEAMAFGVPVIASNAGSLPEVLGGAGPCLLADDVDGLAAALESVLRNPNYAAALSERGLARARDFESATFAEAMIQIYLKAYESVKGGSACLA